MRQTLVVNQGEHEFSVFEHAIEKLHEEYGYEGLAWNMVIASGDFEILCDFLNDDGVFAELE